MPVVFILLAAALFGLYRLYVFTAGFGGAIAAVAAVLATAAMAVGCVAFSVQRYRAVHGRRIQGERLLEASGDWGHLVVNADGRRAQLRLDGQEVDFIFGDIASVAPSANPSNPCVVLQLRTTPMRDWHIPMPNPREARRWARILTLAERRTL